MNKLVRTESICILHSLFKGNILTINDIEQLDQANQSIRKQLIEFIQWILKNPDKWNGVKRIRCINWTGIEGKFLSIFLNTTQIQNDVAHFEFHSAELGIFNAELGRQPPKKKIKLDLHPKLNELNKLLFKHEKEIDSYKKMNKKLHDKIKKLEKERDNDNKNDTEDEIEDFDFDLNKKCKKQIRRHLKKYNFV